VPNVIENNHKWSGILLDQQCYYVYAEELRGVVEH
jgi:hypothetical protein